LFALSSLLWQAAHTPEAATPFRQQRLLCRRHLGTIVTARE
jgi:hypothetical protein